MLNWRVVLLFVLLGAGVGLGYCRVAERVYRATCRFEMVREPRVVFLEQDDARPVRVQDELPRLLVVLKSELLQERVRERLLRKWDDILDEDQRKPKIKVRRSGEVDSLVEVSVDAVHGDYAKEYLAEMLQAFRALRRETVLETRYTALNSLREEREELAERLKDARQELLKFEKDRSLKYSHTIAVSGERSLGSLVQAENALKLEQTILERQLDFLREADEATLRNALELANQASPELFLPTVEEDVEGEPDVGEVEREEEQAVGSSPEDTIARGATALRRLRWTEGREWQRLYGEFLRLTAEYEDQLETYKKNHPKMIRLEEEIDSLARQLELEGETALNRLAGRLSEVKAQLISLRKQQRSWRQELVMTDKDRIQHTKMLAKVHHLKRLYDDVYSRVLNLSVEGIDAVYARTVEPIEVLEDPVWPPEFRIVAMAMLASVAAGQGLVFVARFFVGREFSEVVSIEQRLGLRYVCGIPNWGRVFKGFRPERSRILVTREKTDMATESYRTLRGCIENQIAGAESYALLLTSSDEAEGKTMTTLNLAVLLAWSGRRVLLVDGDLRRGACHRALGALRNPGFCELLVKQELNWRDAVSKTEYDGLDLIPSGTYRHEVPEMLSIAQVGRMIHEWREEYDVVVIDSAPAGRVVDTSVLAKSCDGVLMVVRHGSSHFSAVRHALHHLQQARIIGFCLNDIRPRRMSMFWRLLLKR